MTNPETESEFILDLPKGTHYNVIRVALESGRMAIVILPNDLTNEEVNETANALGQAVAGAYGWRRP
jgi:hypothetical protein